MAINLHNATAERSTTADSWVHQWYLAGLGAVAKCQRTGSQWLDELIEQGEIKEQNSRHAIAATVERAKSQATTHYHDLQHRTENWLQDLWQQSGRAAKNDVQQLAQRVAALSEALDDYRALRTEASHPEAVHEENTGEQEAPEETDDQADPSPEGPL